MESVGTLVMFVVSVFICIAVLIFVIYNLIKHWTDDSMGPK